MKYAHIFLIAEALLALAIAPFVREPLLRVSCVIVGAVSLYSVAYLKQRLWLYGAGYGAFLGVVALFTLSAHPMVRFAGWEGASVIAWILIAYGRGRTARSLEVAFTGFTVNRLGDAFWLASLLDPGWKWGFVVGGWVKAALFPLSFWLIQAMYAPIPVSALLHSALLVALGVYGPIQNPQWLDGLPGEGLRTTAELVALASAMGALLSRVPKAALAWTTSAHLALVASFWQNPPLAQKALILHAYLKASLFLMLGLVQKSLSWNYPLKLAWFSAILLLAAGSSSAGPLGLAAEVITAFALGRICKAYPTTSRLSYFWAFLIPVGLIGMGLVEILQGGFSWHLEGILPVLGAALGFLAPWPKKTYRLDSAFLNFFAFLERGWNGLALQARRSEELLLRAYDKLFKGGLVLMRRLAKGESLLIDGVWRPLLGRLRYVLAASVFPFSTQEKTYPTALQWAFLWTLFMFVLWRYFF